MSWKRYAAGNDVLVELEVLLRNPLLARRMVPHEAMAEMVDRVVVDGHEVPRLQLHDSRRGGVDGGALGDDLRQTLQALVLLLVDSRGVGDERQDLVGLQLPGMDAQLGQGSCERCRMNGPRGASATACRAGPTACW